MTPFYSDDYITIIHGDCLETLPGLAGIRSIVADPQYGIGIVNDGNIGGDNILPAGDYASIVGDDKPFNPSHILDYKNIILWGANYYADKLPPSSSWLIWDKKEGGTSDNFADVEMAWTNLGGPARLLHHLWRGRIKRGDDRLLRRQHPTQKPVALMMWCIRQIKDPGLICDPYTGSGSTLVAAKQLGLKAIGIEIVEEYCEVAARRIEQTTVMLPTMRQTIPEPSQAQLFQV